MALVGNNGSGKSTVAKLCDGFLAPDSGCIKVLGHDLSALDEDSLLEMRRHLGLVFQNPDDQFVASQVLDEVSFGPCNLGIPREEVMQRVGHSLEAVGMLDMMNRNVASLSGGEKQRVAIADALAMEPDVLILDEPTSMLDENGKDDVHRIISELNGKGMTVVLITHDPAESRHADRVLAISNGSVGEYGIGSLEARSCHTKVEGRPDAATCRPGSPIITFDDVSFEYSASSGPASALLGTDTGTISVFHGFDFEIKEHESVALMGPNGSGKSTALMLTNGLLRPTSGSVSVDGIRTDSRQGRIHARDIVGLCMQMPERSIFAQTVYDEIAFGPRNILATKGHRRPFARERKKRKKDVRRGLASEERDRSVYLTAAAGRNEGMLGARGLADGERTASEGQCASVPDDPVDMRVRKAMEAMRLDFDRYSDANPFLLSGGIQRRVAIASVLAMEPRVLALDEPCAGLDIPSRDALTETLLALKASGTTIVMVTHSEDDARAIADRTVRL